jgi:hypothetical protein
VGGLLLTAGVAVDAANELRPLYLLQTGEAARDSSP